MLAWLGLGSNLNQPEIQLQRALASLQELDEVELIQKSGFYQTPAWGDVEQDDFINGVVQISTDLEPLPLLHRLQSVEDEMGRQRSERKWGPRVIDIDLLLYADRVMSSEDLELPHPRMHERAFVLVPLCELAPALEIPGQGLVTKLLNLVDVSGIRRIHEFDVI